LIASGAAVNAPRVSRCGSFFVLLIAGKYPAQLRGLGLKIVLVSGLVRDDLVPSERPPRFRVVPVAGHHVRVQMRDRIAQCEVVELDWVQQGADGAAHGEYLAPVATGVVWRQVGGLSNVSVSPDDGAVASNPGPPLQMDLGVVTSDEENPEIVVTAPERVAHRAPVAGHALSPIGGPTRVGHGDQSSTKRNRAGAVT